MLLVDLAYFDTSLIFKLLSADSVNCHNDITLVNVYVDLVVFTRIAGTS